MDYINYIVKQEGRTLTLVDSSKIIINKYDNKVAKIVFELDETITGRPYFAMLNPVTDKYHIIPIINNCIVIDTKISVYPGRWESLLVVIDDDYEILENDIDQSKFTFISNAFKNIIVRDNFLNEDNIEEDEELNFVINEILDNLIKAQDRLETASANAVEAAQSAQANRDEIAEMIANIDEINTSVNELYDYIIEIKATKNEINGYRDDIKEDMAYIDSSLETINNKIDSIEKISKQVTADKNYIDQAIDGHVLFVENTKKEISDAQETNMTELVNAFNTYISEIRDTGSYYVSQIESVGNNVKNSAESYIEEIQTIGTNTANNIVNAKETAEREISSAKNEAINEVITEGENQYNLIETKGQEILDSINNGSFNPSAPSEEMIESAIDAYFSKNPIVETDPTVPSWAKQPTKPIYTASEVGADPSGTATSAVSNHNISTEAHNDIRILLTELSAKVTNLLNSDDETLDQTKEIVDYIKANRTLIESVTTEKVNVTDIINNLTTNLSSKVLSAAMGVTLKQLIDELTTAVNGKAPKEHSHDSVYYSKSEVDNLLANQSGIQIITWEADD